MSSKEKLHNYELPAAGRQVETAARGCGSAQMLAIVVAGWHAPGGRHPVTSWPRSRARRSTSIYCQRGQDGEPGQAAQGAVGVGIDPHPLPGASMAPRLCVRSPAEYPPVIIAMPERMAAVASSTMVIRCH
jgi:hypothetical protein